MRTTLIKLAVLTALSTTAHAELVPSQSLVSPLDVTASASNTLLLDSQTINATSLAFANTASTTRDAASDTTVAMSSSAARAADKQATEDNSVLGRLSSVASNTVRKVQQSGIASWYGHQFNGRKTATGERFDMNAMTAAHRTLPLSCFIRVTNKDNGKSVIVKVNDRGPYVGNRILDLSYAAAERIGIVGKGMGNVTIERVNTPE
jgi:rare lipoprotein A